MPDGSTDFSPDAPGTTDAKPITPSVERDSSSIAFPYVNLKETIVVARAVHQSGVALSRDQIAGALKVASGSGNFSIKLGAARMFNLLEAVGGKYQLTETGHNVLSSNETEAQMGRRDAFLSVPLYKRAFSEFRGRTLPGRPLGLEQSFVSFGVAPKQKTRARWAFESSAQFAGFFAGGKDRLVEPIITATAQAQAGSMTKDHDRTDVLDVQDTDDPLQEQLIQGLLKRLPKAGTDWDYAKRVQWLRLFASVFDMVYTTPAGPDNGDDTTAAYLVDVNLKKI